MLKKGQPVGDQRKKSVEDVNRRRQAKEPADRVGKKAGKILKANKVVLKPSVIKTKVPAYAGPRFAYFNTDCNLLQDLKMIRDYMKYKHGVDLQMLELFLYLYPINYFTSMDYHDYPFNFKAARISTMIKWGHLVISSNVKNGANMYSLSPKSKRIVREFYMLLSGEEKIPKEDLDKAWKSTQSSQGKKSLDLLKKLTALPPDESKKKLYD